VLLISVDIANIQNHESWSRVNGGSLVLPCRTTDGGPVRWLHSESEITPQYVIFNGHSVEPNYVDKITVNVDQDVGDFNLSLRNVQLNDSGYYLCIEVRSQLVHLRLLTVHGSYNHLHHNEFAIQRAGPLFSSDWTCREFKLGSSSSSSSWDGLAPVGVQCLHDNSSPLRAVLCDDAECLRVCPTPFFDVVHPLSSRFSSPV